METESKDLAIAPKVYSSMSELIADIDFITLQHLRTNIFPDCPEQDIAMAWDWCNRKKYDIMGKAVHLVPFYQKTGRKDNKGSLIFVDGFPETEKKFKLLPGISAYRIDAVRTGNYMGLEAPVIGGMIRKTFVGAPKTKYKEAEHPIDFEFPEWIEVTVLKMVHGQVCRFTAREYWLENYATSSNKSEIPNTMWIKRKIGQLAKCAEAQALRKAFPDVIGALMTFEEMQGKLWDLSPDDYEDITDKQTVDKTTDNTALPPPKKSKMQELKERHKKAAQKVEVKNEVEVKTEMEQSFEDDEKNLTYAMDDKPSDTRKEVSPAPVENGESTFKEIKEKLLAAKNMGELNRLKFIIDASDISVGQTTMLNNLFNVRQQAINEAMEGNK